MKYFKQITQILLGMVLLSILTSGVTAVPQKTTTLPAEIKIGGVFPIVQRPDAGPDRRDGFLIAINEINNQTGADRILPEGVTLIPNVQDDDNSAAGGTAAAQTLIAWGADIVIGSSGSSVSAAMATELTPQKIVQISYASSSPALSDRSLYPYFMRVSSSDADQVKSIAGLVNKFGWTKGATISTSDSYGSSYIDYFTAEWGGTVLTAEQFDAGATDITAQIQAIKNAAPEFILGHFIDVDAATVMKEAKVQGIETVPWIMTDGWAHLGTFSSDEEVEAAMQLHIGTISSYDRQAEYYTFNETWYNPMWNWLEGPARSQSDGAPFNSYAPFAYDAVYVAAKGLAAANSVDGDILLAAMYEVTHNGASREIIFNDLGEVVSQYNYVQLSGTSFIPFGTYKLQSGGAQATPILDNLNNLTLADGSELMIENNAITQLKGPDNPPTSTTTTTTTTTTLPKITPEASYWGILFTICCLVIQRKRNRPPKLHRG